VQMRWGYVNDHKDGSELIGAVLADVLQEVWSNIYIFILRDIDVCFV
jgi:hypothetical protein